LFVILAQSGCQNAFYTDIFQDGAVGKIGLVFPYGAQGWTAEITFAFPVNRLVKYSEAFQLTSCRLKITF